MRKFRFVPMPATAAIAAAIVGLAGVAVHSIATSRAQAPSWTFERIGTGIKPAIAVDAAGAAHVSFLREAIPASTYYATNQSGAWVVRDVAEGYFYGPVDIDVAPDGVAMIAYHDHEGSSFNPALGSGVVLTVGDGTVDEARIDHPGHDQWDADIAAADGGIWHLAGVDPSQFGSADGLEYATNAGGDIVVENVGTGPMAYEFGVSIEIAPTGMIGISFYRDGADDLIYAERAADGTWGLTVVDTEGRTGRYSDLAYDAAGRPHISYWVFDAGSAGRVRYARRGDDGAWSSQDVGTRSAVTGGFAGARKITNIELDADEVPHIMYGDRAEIVYAIRAGGGWSTTQVLAAGDRPLGQLVEFDLDGDGRPHLVTFEVTGTEGGLPSLAGEVIYGTLAN